MKFNFNFLKKKNPAPATAPAIIKRPSKLKPFFILLLAIFLIGLGLRVIPKYAPKILSFKGKAKTAEKPKDGLVTPQEEAMEEAISVRAYRTARADFVDVLPAIGTIKGDKEIELRFSNNGVVSAINFYEGDIIKKGDIIATMDQKEALLKLEYAKSKLKTAEVAEESAKQKLEVNQTLFDQGIIIKPKFEEARLEHESAKTKTVSAQKEVDFALSELDKTYLYSPVSGVMGTRDAETGEFVTSNVKIASLYDVSYVIAEFGIIEKDINKIALGQNVKLNVDTYPNIDFAGAIDNVAPIIEGKSRTLTVKARLKNDNPKGTLLPGMFARVWVSVYEKKNIIKVPSDALYDLDNNGEFDSVYVIDEQNVAHVRGVKLGYITTDVVEIMNGLKENELVVSEAMAPLKDGAKVEIVETQEALF
ncbi:MAG: efflux RND transporter periplasmic adaptor subunit [Candidatus Omnitrophica bacterium]|nr:efflux RND transporter periplasmic adaptor subunit [Candidatus Omnitrophota bacterium]